MNSLPYWQFLLSDVALRPGLFYDRFILNRAYVLSLQPEQLLQNFYLEAGLPTVGQLRNSMHGDAGAGDQWHWGWETPTCQVRGHFLGHWLSAAARICASSGDLELRCRLDRVVTELERCQQKNGGEWVFSIPEKYLHWTAQGQPTWAPHYVIHKTLMGLYDVYALLGDARALTMLIAAARWFYRWTDHFTQTQLDEILDVETGGMLEAWANLYGITRANEHLTLMDRYTRHRLFHPLLAGRDVLTNMHANTTIPEAHGAARAFEVTGDVRWRQIVEAYWACAVEQRGSFATGGQTTGEIWTPSFAFAARRGDKNQEHCTVYNMIRLADYLFRWTGEARYLDYIERNLYNGILAQQHPRTGMIAYFLPLEAGARKLWGHPTHDFWCCHGTLVQAHTLYHSLAFYHGEQEVVVSQYIAAQVQTEIAGQAVALALTPEEQTTGGADQNAHIAGSAHRPTAWTFSLLITCAVPTAFTLRLRIPGWVQGDPMLTLNGIAQTLEVCDGFVTLARSWQDDRLLLTLPAGLTTSPIPDEPGTVAFLAGPVVLAGLCHQEIHLTGDLAQPGAILTPDNERQWGTWLHGYRTVGQSTAIRFKPLYEIIDEPYTVYFPVSG